MNRIQNISDAPLSGFKRKVEWGEFCFTPWTQTVKLSTKVTAYQNVNGEYGDPVEDEYPYFFRTLVASNERMVNTDNNGMLVSQNENGEWIDSQTGLVAVNVMPQYDFFAYLVEFTPLDIPALIENTITAEDLVHQGFNKRP